jgi:eukaryotic-like serine/threonine-protein kinase
MHSIVITETNRNWGMVATHTQRLPPAATIIVVFDQARWQRIEALFDQALALSDEQRRAFVEQECGDDEHLHHEVAELLAAAPTAPGSLRQPIVVAARALAADAVTAQVGRRIGPFRLERLLGEGGMGAVYLAERDDAQFHQRVAVKLLSHSVGSPQAVARFRDERQILAALDHPNIVRLLDGGSTDDGIPYLVMEHIEGGTLTHYARERNLTVRAQVMLIRQVCAALQYAHQNLVVHRDVKPSNILVDKGGTPKVLDFGIAKLLAPSTELALEARTRTGFAIFTPEYGSPEQARGESISTATDVYSTGAVLYELLAGRPPHRTTGSQMEVLRSICEDEPAPPSAVAPATRRSELAGDLDNIVLKTLHKEPGQRYASMEQLADDLGRWLSGLPVQAHASTFGYRARKFLRRNKVLVAAAAVVSLALLGATGVSLRQASRADEQAARAEVERGKALEAARRANAETERARTAEAQVQTQLDELRAEQQARGKAEAESRAKSTEVALSREQLQVALEQTRREKALAEQESQRARTAEEQAQAAAAAEKKTRREAQALYEKERARVEQLEKANKQITTKLP